MDAKSRKKKIKEILKGPSAELGKIRLTIDNQSKAYECHAVPVKYLVFNQYNGRIGSYVTTYERTKGPIQSFKPEGEKLIMEFLWEMHTASNEHTYEDIKKNGQQVPGVITLDGVIVDGNRRCLMLKKMAEEKNAKPVPFICAVLPFTIDAKPQEIRKLETELQHRDDKVGYGPIEKYLTCRTLTQDGLSHEEIAHLMNEKNGAKAIKENLEILKLMDLYLQWIDAEGIYKYLAVEKLEGPFWDIQKTLSTKTAARDWSPTKRDESDLQMILFDFIRAGYRKEIRNIIRNKGGAFNNRSAWERIVRNYKGSIAKINSKQQPLPKNEASDVEKLRQRDTDWREQAGDPKGGPIHDIMQDAEEDLKRRDLVEKPMKLLSRIENDLQKLLAQYGPLTTPNEKETLQEIKDLVSKLSGKKQ